MIERFLFYALNNKGEYSKPKPVPFNISPGYCSIHHILTLTYSLLVSSSSDWLSSSLPKGKNSLLLWFCVNHTSIDFLTHTFRKSLYSLPPFSFPPFYSSIHLQSACCPTTLLQLWFLWSNCQNKYFSAHFLLGFSKALVCLSSWLEVLHSFCLPPWFRFLFLHPSTLVEIPWCFQDPVLSELSSLLTLHVPQDLLMHSCYFNYHLYADNS